MKKKIIALFAVIAVFGLAIAAVAYAQTTTADAARSSCCKKDSCPMKKADHEKGDKHAKGEHHNCCGDSCPMKAKGSDNAKAEGHDCDCCGDSCPMKKGVEAKATTVSMTESGKSCCDNCDCCKGKHEDQAL